MTSLVVKIETMDEFKARAVKSMKDAQKGKAKPYHGISFPTYADMHETLAPPCLEIIRALAGQGPLAIREVARRVGRDVQAVHRDVTRLINAGVIERDERGIRFDYDGLKFAFEVGVGV